MIAALGDTSEAHTQVGSVTVTASRNISGFPLAPEMSTEYRQQIVKVIRSMFGQLQGTSLAAEASQAPPASQASSPLGEDRFFGRTFREYFRKAHEELKQAHERLGSP